MPFPPQVEQGRSWFFPVPSQSGHERARAMIPTESFGGSMLHVSGG
jgi:hypothetical protein